MKAVTLLLACALMASAALAQGTINFTNLKPTKQQVFDADGKPLKGAWAQLHAGKTADSMVPVGPPVAFFDDFKEGYYTSGAVDVGFLGLGFFQVWAWKGAETFDLATQIGKSNVLQLRPGDPRLGGGPELPRDLIGLESFSLERVNEPIEPTELKITGSTVLPFAFTFTTAKGVTYEVQASNDLMTWGVLKKMRETSGEAKFTDHRKALFTRQYYRVKQTE
ncbi:MAG: hypothetical protein COC21_04000 [Verrucomicrobiales bacterium]|jgi:hypothetical protein|nr:hypothetical protein [Pedosphaera sp.]PCH54803.1 MAG: hypothetical protein COC21_04000 [Verrucomicrobiales bacterium]